MLPVTFLQGLFCIDGHGRKLTGSTAKITGCTRYKRLAANAYAHHPYTRAGASSPATRSKTGEITYSSASRLKSLLAQGARARRIQANVPIYYTEYGVQTDPPDPLAGVPPVTQAYWLNLAEQMSYADPRIKSYAQYLLQDPSDVASFQTGLEFTDGSEKPSFDAYRLPLTVTKAGGSFRIWGGVKPPGGSTSVELQRATSKNGPFTTAQTLQLSGAHRYFQLSTAQTGFWRLSWTGSDSTTHLSRVASPGA